MTDLQPPGWAAQPSKSTPPCSVTENQESGQVRTAGAAENGEKSVTYPMDQFQQLEERLGKIVETYKRTQAENRELAGQLEKLRSDSKHGVEERAALEREVEALRREREGVRARVERLLSQVEALTKQDSAG